MAFTERKEHNIKIIPPYYIIKCTEYNVIEYDGEVISKIPTKYTRAPGEDVTNDCLEIQNIAKEIWTEEIIAKYQEYQESIADKQFP